MPHTIWSTSRLQAGPGGFRVAIMVETQAAALVLITLIAAIVNGALGYGFSSITVPIALLFLANRVLNPALVLIEVVLNAYVLWNNRDALAQAGELPSMNPP